jgi:hypothetical protein
MRVTWPVEFLFQPKPCPLCLPPISACHSPQPPSCSRLRSWVSLGEGSISCHRFHRMESCVWGPCGFWLLRNAQEGPAEHLSL